jgi:hypothetical protein
MFGKDWGFLGGRFKCELYNADDQKQLYNTCIYMTYIHMIWYACHTLIICWNVEDI